MSYTQTAPLRGAGTQTAGVGNINLGKTTLSAVPSVTGSQLGTAAASQPALDPSGPPPDGISLYEWYSRPRPDAFRLYSAGNVFMADSVGTSVELTPVGVRADAPSWNGKLETLDLFHGSLNMYFQIYQNHITRHQAIYLTIMALPLQYQLEVANMHFMQYYEIVFILKEAHQRIQLSKLRCRSNKIEDVLDYLAEHNRLYSKTDSVAGQDAQDLLIEGMPTEYRPPVPSKPVTKREHLQEVELMAYHIKFNSGRQQQPSEES